MERSVRSCGIKIISIVLFGIIINIGMFAKYDIYTGSMDTNSENISAYSDLKGYEQKLNEDIIQIKRELAEKETYLASLDEELIELECQYNKLLEENKRVSDKLNSLRAGKVYK